MSNYEFKFKEVAYVGWANNRLILSPKYIIAGHEFNDILIIHDGKIDCYNLLHFAACFLGGHLDEKDYESGRELIMDGCNRWCRNLGLPEITEKI